jgi:hypothetical protein
MAWQIRQAITAALPLPGRQKILLRQHQLEAMAARVVPMRQKIRQQHRDTAPLPLLIHLHHQDMVPLPLDMANNKRIVISYYWEKCMLLSRMKA